MLYSEERRRVWNGLTQLGLSFNERSRRLGQWDRAFNNENDPLSRIRIGLRQAVSERLPGEEGNEVLLSGTLALHWKKYCAWDNGWGAFIPKPTAVAVPGFEATLANRELVKDAIWWEVACLLDFKPAMVSVDQSGTISLSTGSESMSLETAVLPDWTKSVLPWARVWALVEGFMWSNFRATPRDLLAEEEYSLVVTPQVGTQPVGPVIDYPFVYLASDEGLTRAARNLARQSPLAPAAD